MNTLTAKQVRKALEDAGMSVDAVRTRKGLVEVKRSYFYRMGNTADEFAERVRKALASQGIIAPITSEDRWAAWPKTSWFAAIVG
jgi:hypothetical protein